MWVWNPIKKYVRRAEKVSSRNIFHSTSPHLFLLLAWAGIRTKWSAECHFSLSLSLSLCDFFSYKDFWIWRRWVRKDLFLIFFCCNGLLVEIVGGQETLPVLSRIHTLSLWILISFFLFVVFCCKRTKTFLLRENIPQRIRLVNSVG